MWRYGTHLGATVWCSCKLQIQNWNFFDKPHMFEARLEQSALLKKLFEAVKELCKDVRFDCNENGIALQAMDRYVPDQQYM